LFKSKFTKRGSEFLNQEYNGNEKDARAELPKEFEMKRMRNQKQLRNNPTSFLA